MNRTLMTATGFGKIEEELKRLKTADRPAVIKAIAEARAHGDLSENAEYSAAREQQSHIEGRIQDLTALIGRAQVVNVSKLDGPIKFGATVELEDDDSGERRTYQIVSEVEADIGKGLLNIDSPLARSLIGRDEGDSVSVRTPGGNREFTILAVKYV